jgi:hypothetical protein
MIKKLYNGLPESYKSHISRVNYLLGNKPKVMVDKTRIITFPGNEKGGVIFSADFELGWAVRYSKHPKDPVKFASEERKNVPIILNQAEKYNISMVWATVGHLFLDSCKKGDHDWMHRPPYFDDHWKFTSGDWFDCDPYTRWNEAKAWYAPDLIEKIQKCTTPQEFACHTFSHIDCSYKNCPPEVIDDELKACTDIASKWGVKFKSLTFPGGTAGNYETLLKYGIEICRKRHLDYEIAYPFYNEHGMLITPTGPVIAMGYSQWSPDYLLSRYKKAIDKAINNNSLVHFWFHPSQEEQTFTQLLPGILKYCSVKREKGELWIGTMAVIAEHIKQVKKIV